MPLRSRTLTGLLWAAAVGLALLGVFRTADLARDGWTPRAAAEARWFPWAWGTPRDRALIPSPHRVADPAPGNPTAPIYIADPLKGSRPHWVHVMTQYALPDRTVIGVGPAAASPGGSGVVRLTRLDGATAPLLVSGSPSLSTRFLELAAFGLGLGLAWMLGWGWMRLGGELGREGGTTGESGSRFTLGATTVMLGLTGAALVAAVAGLVGLPSMAFPVATALVAVGIAAWGRRLGTNGSRFPPSPPVAPRTGGARLQPGDLSPGFLVALTGGLTALFLARTAVAPLWSWDHFAIWGFKARRIAEVGAGTDLFAGVGGLAKAFPNAHVDYPLGLPLAWVQLAPFTEPGAWLFRLAHGLFGVLLVVSIYGLARRLGAARPFAALAAAWTAASPLFFDTESLGLAEMALSLWLVAGLGWALRPDGARPWVAGVLLGFLPWIKTEGLPLAVLAVGALVVVSSRTRWVGLVAPAAVLALAARLHGALVGGDAASWAAGDALGRLTERLGDPGAILAALGEDLVAAPWLGMWVIFAVAWPVGAVVAFRRGGPRHPAVVVGLVAAAQLALYGAVYFLTYLDPVQHIDSSFARIAAALGPPAAAVVAGLSGMWNESARPE